MIRLIIITLLIIYILYKIFLERKKLKKIKLINFNSSWCYWSKKMSPLWDELKSEMKFNNIDIIDIKCDYKINKKLCDKYDIYEYPTIKLINEDKVIEYNGEINLDDIVLFIKKNI